MITVRTYLYRVPFLITTLFVALFSITAFAQDMRFIEYQVTASTSYETTPVIGNDGISDIIVYSMSAVIDLYGNLGPGDIWYQRIDESGAPYGSAVQVTIGSTDDKLNDIWGDFIVFTSYAFSGTPTGTIILYQISTGIMQPLGSAIIIQEPKIHGMNVVWIEGGAFSTQVMLYELAWLGTPTNPWVLAGPNTPAFTVDIGDRFVVWSELSGTQYDIWAYDLVNMVTTRVTSTPNHDELDPTTSGAWVTYEKNQHSMPAKSIEIKNLDTNVTTVIIDDGANNRRPAIHRNLGYYNIAYESDIDGDFDIYLYEFSTQEIFRVTSHPEHQYLNNLHKDLIAYVDQRNASEDIFVTKFSPNFAPVANAGLDQSIQRYDVATLDGSASTDPDGDYPLTYSWTMESQPAGSMAVLTGETSLTPTLTADVVGEYIVELIVTDALGKSSDTDAVIVTTINLPPVADAGPDQAVLLVGTTILLDGSQSYDPEGDDFTYAWEIKSKPADSTATLDDPTSSSPSFIADISGNYVIELAATDEFGAASEPDSIIVSFDNIAPVADAGPNQAVVLDEVACLDGSNSWDANGDPLTYYWQVVSYPDSSDAGFDDMYAVQPCLEPDFAGTYVITLVVHDGITSSAADYVTITATTAVQDEVTAILLDSVEDINALSVDVFKNRNMQNALTSKINAALEKIDQGYYQEALNKLENDILGKTDGCATIGEPDKNDWIKDCEAQNAVYPQIIEAINLLRELI